MHPAHGSSRYRRIPSFAVLALLAAVAGVVVATVLAGTSRPASAEEVHGLEFEVAYPADDGWRTVRLHLLVLDDGERSLEEIEAEARQDALARYEGGFIVEPRVTAQYVALGWSWPDNTASWQYNPAGSPNHLGNVHDVFRDSAESWNEGGSPFRFTGGGATAAGPGLCSGDGGMDGENTVGWQELGGSTLAMTCFDNLGDASEFDIVFDIDRDWTTDTDNVALDLQSVGTHEFGHALGLNHPGRDVTGAVMSSPYSRGDLIRELQPDDRDGLHAIYGTEVSQDPSPTSSPTPDPTSTPMPTSTMPPTGTPGDGTPTPTAEPATPDPSGVEQRGVVPGLVRQ